MSIAVFLKENLKNIPPNLGKFINRVPYNNRPGIGKLYAVRKKDIKEINTYTAEQKQNSVYSRVKSLVDYAYHAIPFYKEYYDKQGFNPSELCSFKDIQSIPVITKSILNEYDLKKRSAIRKGRYIVNTGGSSGTPFGFYIEPDSMGHEWAHMHTIWGKLGYKVSDFKLGFGGRSDIGEHGVKYDVVRNSFSMDIYAEYDLIADKLKKILKKYEIKYLHGYPSLIYDFALYCRHHDAELQQMLSKSLKGAFLGSEYPHEQYRDIIENTFDIKTISWYGHTERAVLAYEKHEKFLYEPFLSYGFSEALPAESESGNYALVCTSYYNFASPFIRYNTDDVISAVTVNEGVLESFRITKGRDGEFVIDKAGKKINLTGLIFGRHHEIFNYSKFIQVKQINPGSVEIHFVSDSLTTADADKLFDKDNLNIDLSFVKRDEPFRTKSGKTSLLIKE